jgi:hypothetical protein
MTTTTVLHTHRVTTITWLPWQLLYSSSINISETIIEFITVKFDHGMKNAWKLNSLLSMV